MDTQPAAPNAPSLATVTGLDGLIGYLQHHRNSLAQSVRCGVEGLAVARRYSDLVDGVIARMLEIACGRIHPGLATDGAPIAIVATGGYGRRELSPHSDIDLTFVPARDGDTRAERIIKEMFTMVMRVFMDAAGMEVGYAYRLMEDCDNLDHQTASGLLDARLIAGNPRIFIQLEHAYWSHFNPADFVFTKLDERRAQCAKTVPPGSASDVFTPTPRMVEPDLKNGPGGLRDLQTAVWLTQAIHNLPAARVRGDRVWEVLERYAGLTSEECAQLKAAKEFLIRTRNALHVCAGAAREQLVVTRQEEVARCIGYAASEEGSGHPAPQEPPPVERFMADLYVHASAISRIAGAVMEQAENARMFLGIGLDCAGRCIEPAGSVLTTEDPVWMLWACELAQRYRLRMSHQLQREIARVLAGDTRTKHPKELGAIFTRILASRNGCWATLQQMAELGILGWMLPEFGAVLNMIPYDPSHDYTVGQHTLYAVRFLDALRAATGPEETSELRRLLAELPHPEQLYLALLLHDVGKCRDDRPHSDTGAEIAEAVCRRLGWDPAATENVVFLVRHHLLMAETSRLRDLNLDETIRDFTTVVNDLDRLHMLYLLTYADTSAVGAGVWTQVKARFLMDLAHRAERFLSSEEEAADDAELTRTRRRLLRELSVENLDPAEVALHVASMPAPYILNTSLAEIALHIGFVRRVQAGETVVEFQDERNGTYTEVTVCTRDDPEPGLLSKIAGVLYAADLDVHAAQVFTRVSAANDGEPERIAIDRLYVDFRGRRLTPGKRRELATNLPAVLNGRTSVADLLQKRNKSPEVGGPVENLAVRNDLSDTFTVVEVSSREERAMLYRVTGALSMLGWDIHSAKLSHFRGRSVASFYVTGAKHLTDADARSQLARLMPVSS
ncbi:MAG: HD domain-containing protein [Chthonomonadales bacterium]